MNPGSSFNSRPREAGDQSPHISIKTRWSFNSRPREAGDLRLCRRPCPRRVSIHARAKRATSHTRQHSRLVCFNSRPREAGDLTAAQALRMFRFQFTPARSGRLAPPSNHASGKVSIHARAKRATLRVHLSPPRVRVSIHARAKRATYLPARSSPRQGFNSRPREAGDSAPPVQGSPSLVSIHARAKRATVSAVP